MPRWAIASVLYFVYIAVAALLLPRLPARARVQACAAAGGGLFLAALGYYTDTFWLRLGVLPPLTLLASYWSSGFLWTGPMERIERFFVRSDRSLRIGEIAASTESIDLHGKTQREAHAALVRFLRRAQREGARFVLVITGKGVRGSADGERGVLRRQVPLWLQLPELRAYVVGFEAAHVGHGGEGALYVRIRKSDVA